MNGGSRVGLEFEKGMPVKGQVGELSKLIGFPFARS
jgi:hypothetical protein